MMQEKQRWWKQNPMKHTFRYFILFIMCLVNISIPLNTRNMIYALQPMINHTALEGHHLVIGDHPGTYSHLQNTCHNDSAKESTDDIEDGPYLFSTTRQSYVLGLLAVGQLLGALLAIVIYDYCYMGPILGISVLWYGLNNVAMKFIADKGGSIGVMVSRIGIGMYVGMLTPVNNAVVHSWFTINERGTVLAIINSGNNVGNLLFAVSGLVVSAFKWDALFWIPGVFAILCALLVFIFFSDDPGTNRYISEEEKKLLNETPVFPKEYFQTGETVNNKMHFKQKGDFSTFHVSILRVTRKEPVPWCKALKYLQVWALLSCVLGHEWAVEATMTYTHIYLTEIHDYSLSKSAFLNTVPTNISIIVFGIIGSLIADFCIHKNICKKSTVRRIGGLFLASTGIYFLLLGLLPCKTVDQTIIGLLVFSSFRSGAFVSLLPFFQDISPTYQDNLVSASTIVGILPGFAVPFIISLVGKNTRTKWVTIFIITAVVIFLSVGFFILSIRPEIQEFDKMAIEKERMFHSLSKTEIKNEPDTSEALLPQRTVEFAKKTFPEGYNHLTMSIWDVAKEATIFKISNKIARELKGT